MKYEVFQSANVIVSCVLGCFKSLTGSHGFIVFFLRMQTVSNGRVSMLIFIEQEGRVNSLYESPGKVETKKSLLRAPQE